MMYYVHHRKIFKQKLNSIYYYKLLRNHIIIRYLQHSPTTKESINNYERNQFSAPSIQGYL